MSPFLLIIFISRLASRLSIISVRIYAPQLPPSRQKIYANLPSIKNTVVASGTTSVHELFLYSLTFNFDLHRNNVSPAISEEGDIEGTQYRNTVRKIGKYRNTVSKMDEIPIPHLSSVTLTYNVVSISRVFFFLSQAFRHQKSTLAFARKHEKISN